jgi:metallophosphoesterase superfamily enzyme
VERSNRYRLKPNEIEVIQRMRKDKVRNVLVVGDLHEPFCLDTYLDFCLEQYNKYNISDVIFIGDIVDNHYSSYHETSADGMGGADELELSIKRIARWYKAFPVAKVIIGNHDRMIMRKAQTSAIPSKWIKSYKEVLEVPNWDFLERYEQDNVQYIHGEGGTARTKCRADMMNTVQGHLHTQCYTEWYVGMKFRVFGTQVGCGINHESYAMAYAKYGKKPAIGCTVVLENGTIPINLLMPL